jgi:Zn-dependent peptidase ImmA (M78 family)
MSDRERQRRERQRRDSYSIAEWCVHRRISRAMFYLLDRQGLAPKTYYVGARRFISDEADAAWLTAREAESEQAA